MGLDPGPLFASNSAQLGIKVLIGGSLFLIAGVGVFYLVEESSERIVPSVAYPWQNYLVRVPIGMLALFLLIRAIGWIFF